MAVPERLRLAELAASLSLATDLASGYAMQDALRGCVTSVRLGQRLQIADDDLADSYYLSLLAALGCTAGSHRAATLVGAEIEVFSGVAAIDATDSRAVTRLMLARVGAGRPALRRLAMLARLARSSGGLTRDTQAHCEVSQMLAARLGFESRFQQHLLQVFERWDGRGQPAGLRGDAISLPARLSLLCHQACGWARVHGVGTSMAMVRRYAGRTFDPQLAAGFIRHGEELLTSLDAARLWDTVLDTEPAPRRWLKSDQIDSAAEAVADFADLKSPFTIGHSRGVAQLAHEAARACGLSEADAREVRLAGFLHDVGRAGVSNDVWDKPGFLTPSQWERARLHSRFTARILARLDSLGGAVASAALHHERLDGSGYHEGKRASDLLMSARILAAADVHHALIEARPHRPAWMPSEAAALAEAEVEAGRLDADAVKAVLVVAGRRHPPTLRPAPGGLTELELEVLQLIARGLPDQQIALERDISHTEVAEHVARIYEKVDVSTRSAATLFALQNGLLRDAVPA